MSATALSVVQRSFTMRVRAESWLDGELLAADIPVDSGSEDRDRSLNVPERVSLTVPRRDRGFDWDPGADPAHPLAAYGQQLRVSYGVDIGGDFEWIDRGWFLITESGADEDTVTVTAQGLLTLIDEAKFVAPFQPSGTFTSTIRSLVEPALTVQFDSGLTDKSVPVGMQWDDDRLGGLTEILDSWAADASVTTDGTLFVEPLTDTGTPVLALTDGTGGTVLRWQGATTRDGAFNCVVAQGEDANGNTVQGVAYDTDPNSPFMYGGPFNSLPVPYPFSSSLMTSVAQCRAAAAAKLIQLRRSASRKLTVTMVPHPGLMTGDVISATGAGLTAAPCMIEGLSLPYAPDTMSLTVRVL
ncbi:DUF5047 domain-containing protein [Streptomyces cylindrosporus]|uniref:DUF5047 domain-containing protein n=1 Tax=Streptomyces cylindrosporus TaxID=2927583 RepID=A0ABS9YJY5_9ACTN|nr:DUF5047 domain-containing protein [Streptomyces cylindrosporus]MCI3277533.1 DUF5047 domain-containing protein [Streptomyces cylindrosporus]